MKYLQVTKDSTVEIANYPKVWDENNYCTPEALIRDGKAEQFGVIAVEESPQPEYDRITQAVSCSYLEVDGVWSQVWSIQNLDPESVTDNRFKRDEARYTKRASVKDHLIAYMAADNMSRVRNGVWSVQDLTSLLADPAVVAANQFMSTLSFELAAQAIARATSPLLTAEIKSSWISKLQTHFYL